MVVIEVVIIIITFAGAGVTLKIGFVLMMQVFINTSDLQNS